MKNRQNSLILSGYKDFVFGRAPQVIPSPRENLRPTD